MSLQVWLPLNGDLHNQGLSGNTTLTAYGGPTVNSAGKIGSCYILDGTDDYFQFSNLNIDGLSELSLCFWCYSTSGNLGGIFLVRQTGSNHNLNITSTGLSFRDSTHSSLVSLTFEQPTANTWTHYSIVYDKGSWRVYKNGVEKLNQSYATANLNSSLTEVRIGRAQSSSGNVYFTGKLNDFRIYDHALSPKEVEEISKGLVLHYKLDDPYSEGTTNLCTQLVAGGRTTVTNNIVTNTGADQDTYWYIKPKEALVGGATYTVSCYLNGFSSNSTYISWGVCAQSGTNFAGSWQTKNGYNTFTFTMPSGLDGSTANIIFDDNGGTRTEVFSISQVQLEKKDHATPFIGYGLTRTPTAIYDSSGYSNNGTIAGALTAAAGSPRYNTSTVFSSPSSNYISNASSPVGAQTFSFWLKISDLTAKSYPIFSDSNSKLCMKCSGNSNPANNLFRFNIYIQTYTGTSSDKSNDVSVSPSDNINLSQWNFFVITLDNDVPKMYINGVSKTPAGKTSESALGTGLYIGKTSNAPYQISDFRMYATTLTIDQIKELYNTSATIDNAGNIYAREIKEA